MLLPNADEARLLTGCADVADAARALAARHEVVAISLGAEGALWASAGGLVHRPAHPTVVVDTTGAGDAFASGLLAAWLGDRSVDPADGPRRGPGPAADVVPAAGRALRSAGQPSMTWTGRLSSTRSGRAS